MADEETTKALGARSRNYVHEGQVAYIEETYGTKLSDLSPAEVIAAAYATRNEWRRTDTYRKLVDGHAAVAEKERETAKAAKAAERAKAKEAKDAEKAKAKAEKEAAAAKAEKATKATKATKAASPAKAAKATKATKKQASGSEDPFS